jgi:hypothetical protein
MAFFRQYIAPLLIVLVFLLALVATSARTFLPDGLSAPAPVSEAVPSPVIGTDPSVSPTSSLPDSLSILIEGIPSQRSL